jgi:nitrite reductase (NO-forming)
MANLIQRYEMKKLALIILVPAILTFYCSCGNNKKTGNSEPSVTSAAKAPAEKPKPVAHVASPGEIAFRKNCLTCHQADGSGVPDMYPPLHKADLVKGPPEGIIRAILFGLKGPAVVNGKTYPQPMPAQNLLSDSTIAVLVTYVKQRWDSTEVSVTPEDVRKIRAGGRH